MSNAEGMTKSQMPNPVPADPDLPRRSKAAVQTLFIRVWSLVRHSDLVILMSLCAFVVNIHLTSQALRGSLRAHVKNLRHHRIQSHAWQRYSPAWFGQEKRRCGPARNEKCAACLRAEFASPAHLGARAREVCARSRDGARS
jgi:hypothetical protein